MKEGAAGRIAKAVAGLGVLLLILFVVIQWLGDYRGAKSEGGAEPTATTAPAETPTPESKTKPAAPAKAANVKVSLVQVLMDGVNFREEPDADAEVIRGLNKGEKLTLLKKQENWYNCKDSKGVSGWLSANPSYSKVIR